MTQRWLTMGVALGCGLVTMAGPSAQAASRQTDPRIELEIRSLTGDTQRSPQYDDGGGRDDWYILNTTYSTDTDWIDELTFTYYALFRPDRDQAGVALDPGSPYLLLRGRVTYIHVPKGRHESLMFIHPRLLERFGSVERIAVVITAPGIDEPLAYAGDPPGRAGWWQQLRPVDGLMLNRDESPYGPVLADDHEMIRPAGGNSR